MENLKNRWRKQDIKFLNWYSLIVTRYVKYRPGLHKYVQTGLLVCAPWARSNGCKSRTCPDSGKCIAEQQGESNQHDINISNYAAVSHIRNNSMRHWKTSGICTHSLNDNNQRTLISSQMTSYQCNRDSLPFFRQFSGRMRYYERIQDYGPVLNSKITVS